MRHLTLTLDSVLHVRTSVVFSLCCHCGRYASDIMVRSLKFDLCPKVGHLTLGCLILPSKFAEDTVLALFLADVKTQQMNYDAPLCLCPESD